MIILHFVGVRIACASLSPEIDLMFLVVGFFFFFLHEFNANSLYQSCLTQFLKHLIFYVR